MESPSAFPNLSYVQTEIFGYKYTEYFVQIVNSRIVESSFIVAVFVPDRRKWARNDVEDRNSSLHERDVVIFDTPSGEIKAEKIRTFGAQ